MALTCKPRGTSGHVGLVRVRPPGWDDAAALGQHPVDSYGWPRPWLRQHEVRTGEPVTQIVSVARRESNEPFSGAEAT